jgi:hypothetical protein
MAANSTINLTGTIAGLSGGSRVIGPLTFVSAAANGQTLEVTLASGDNTITIPSSPATSGCVIVLPSSGGANTKLKGNAGDTGLNIGTNGWVVLTWTTGTPPTALILNSFALQTGVTEIIFF